MNKCPYCDTELPEETPVCPRCGREQAGPAGEAAPDDTVTREAVIGKHADEYIKKFDRMAAAHTPVSWNTAAFFFGALWMAYRGLYVQALCYTLLASCVGWRVTDPLQSAALNAALWILTGVFGNRIYMSAVNARLTKARTLQGAAREAYLRRNAPGARGVLIFLAVLAAIVFAVLWYASSD
ncbi:MAG: DUF2628 domain-containing protein [Abditibacteriota bacterium]|nr:DUF2628 domain-containing protein [Abditibacteriota bacterium]